MQVVRTMVILFGLAIVAVGLYLFVLGVGAPIEIKSIEIGWVKGSATGAFVGLLVAGVGLAVSFGAMHFFKREVETKTEVHAGGGGGWSSTTTRVVQAPMDDRY